MSATATQTDALTSAFHAFNERSLQLETSYRDLQQQVASLTSRLRASQSARHRELLEREGLADKLSRTLEALPGAVVVLGADGCVEEYNERASVLLNAPLTGLAWSDIVRREFSQAMSRDGELQLQDGRILALSRNRLNPGQGEILLLTDVTDSRRMAALLARHERLSAIGEMTARLAHQIRTPLASALLYASQLTPGTQSDDSPGGRIVSRLRELDRMVNDMLHYAGGTQPAAQSINVARFLADIAETARPRIDGHRSLAIAVADDSLAFTGNSDALKGALLNLVDNAAAACGDNGRIEIGAVQDGDRLCLTVTDNGHGIAASDLQRVFEPFFTTRPSGTGLGLAVVRSVAEAHGGKLLVESAASGTTIALCLPAAHAAAIPATRETCHA